MCSGDTYSFRVRFCGLAKQPSKISLSGGRSREARPCGEVIRVDVDTMNGDEAMIVVFLAFEMSAKLSILGELRSERGISQRRFVLGSVFTLPAFRILYGLRQVIYPASHDPDSGCPHLPQSTIDTPTPTVRIVQLAGLRVGTDLFVVVLVAWVRCRPVNIHGRFR